MKVRYLINNLTYVFFALVEAFLVLRFILKIFGASASNGFVSWVYEMSSVLLDPFRGIFPVKVYENTYVLEFSTLFAMLMYAVAAVLLFAVLDALAGLATKNGKK